MSALRTIGIVSIIGIAFSTPVVRAENKQPAKAAKGAEGLWLGVIKVGSKELRILIHLSKKPDGTLSGTLDSLDQGARGLPIEDVTWKDGKLRFELKVAKAAYDGKINADEIAGDWKQGGQSLPLTFKRTDKAPEPPKRPQEPKKPYPYAEEEVRYENKSAGIKLAGTLTLPRGTGPFPAALLITGSGPQDRNEMILNHKPFLVLADYLTRRGIAVLRVDDRGVGGSTGDTMRSTTEDFAGDVLAGVDYLKSRKEINPHEIGLIGHSEGGIIAPLVASRSKDVAFIVMMAGTGLPGEEVIHLQKGAILRAEGTDEDKIAKDRTLQTQIFSVVRQEKDPAVARKKLRELMKAEVQLLAGDDKKTSGDEKKQAAIKSAPVPEKPKQAAGSKTQQSAKSKSPSALPANADSKSKPAPETDDKSNPPAEAKKDTPDPEMEQEIGLVFTPWYRFFLGYDPRPALRKVRCPVLALNGDKDVQVVPRENTAEIEKALRAGGNKDFTVKILPGLNHLFQTCKTGSVSEYEKIEETLSPTALQIMGDWIVKHTSAGKQATGK
jgi:pimeloyl-ACP methyl ester carboxylesterase